MTFVTLPNGRIPDVAYWTLIGWPPDESDIRSGRFPSARLVERYARRWKPHWAVTLQHVADAEGCTLGELRRDLAREHLARACGRAERLTNYWPSSKRRGEKRPKPQPLIALERLDPLYDENFPSQVRSDTLAWFLRWLDRAVLSGMDAQLRRWHEDATEHVGVWLDDPSAMPVRGDLMDDDDVGVERARATILAIIDAVSDDIIHARKSPTKDAAARALPILRAYLRGEDPPFQERDRLYLQRLCKRKGIASPWCRSAV